MRTLLTTEGYARFKAELTYLLDKERPEITKIVTWAASQGDRSENADYTYNKKKLREIDRRVRYLTKLFSTVQVVEYSPKQEGKVFFGAWVELINDEDETLKFRIVGKDEIYGHKDYISFFSPMAKACIGKSEGDEIQVHTPEGIKYWEIVKISYNQSS